MTKLSSLLILSFVKNLWSSFARTLGSNQTGETGDVQQKNDGKKVSKHVRYSDAPYYDLGSPTTISLKQRFDKDSKDLAALKRSTLRQSKEEIGSMILSGKWPESYSHTASSTLPTLRRNSGRKATLKSSQQKKRKQSKTKPLPATKVS